MLLATALVLSLIGVVELFGGGARMHAVAMMVVGALLVRRYLLTSRTGEEVMLCNLAVEETSRGRFEEAEGLLDRLSRQTRRWQRMVHLQRAVIAFHRGDTATTIAEATAAIEMPLPMFQRDNSLIEIANAYALRAVGRAVSGAFDAAREDATRVESSLLAGPRPFARAWLARLIIFDRERDPAEQKSLFARASRAMEWLSPRERVLARALRRRAYAQPRSVYREPARPDDSSERTGVAAWVAQIAPEAASYAVDAGSYASTAAAATVDSTTAEAESAIKAERSQGRIRFEKPRVVFWALLGLHGRMRVHGQGSATAIP